ncbi:MAG: hypothetical protein IPN69_01695 [Acidobacteria bacterium]|nr:hypothetical protein [Acidobacteriota bacterium]
MSIVKHLDPGHSSLSQLQGTCNTLERGLRAKLKSLQAATNPDNAKITVATFEEFDGPKSELGKAKLDPGEGHTAFINNEVVKISITRSS